MNLNNDEYSYDLIDYAKNRDGTDVTIDPSKVVRNPKLKPIEWRITETIGVGIFNPKRVYSIRII